MDIIYRPGFYVVIRLLSINRQTGGQTLTDTCQLNTGQCIFRFLQLFLAYIIFTLKKTRVRKAWSS